MPTRPPALIRGPSAKPRSRQVGAFDQPRGLGQRDQADVAPFGHDLEALGDEGAVERLQAGDVGDRAQRDDVEQVDELRFGLAGETAAVAQLAQQRDAEQEGHADRRDMAVRSADLAFVEPVGIDQGMGDGKAGRALVMVADDHVEAGVGRLLQRFERLGAAVDGDRQRCAAPLQFDQRRARRAIALHQPVGDIDHRLDAEAAEQDRQQRRGGRTVDVIIAENGDGLAGLDRVGQPRRRLVHVPERRGVGQEIADGRRAVAGEVGFLDAAGQQQLVDQVAAELIAAAAPPAPWLAEQAALHAAGEGRS